MLKEIRGNILINECHHCKALNEYDITGLRSEYLEEFGEYENLGFSCPNCDSSIVFNMNIPTDDIDEPFASGDLPEAEEIQRYYVRLLMRMTRADLIKE